MTVTQQLIIETLPILDLDHPGAHDSAYTQRREQIAFAAKEFHLSDPATREIPLIDYTKEEHGVWRHICQTLKPLQEQFACSWYQEGRQKIFIPTNRLPHIRDLSKQMEKLCGFKLEPVHGLVTAREFLSKLADDTMLCTQYIRHPSKPEFTPEPDIVHEIIGHLPMLTNPELRAFSHMIGTAARRATEEQMVWLSRLYWYTIEFGLIEENGKIKAFGAGLLGGIQDLTRALSRQASIKPFEMEEVIGTDYNYSFEQPVFFVISSFEFLRKETEQLLTSFG